MDLPTALGFAAAALTTTALLPQVIRIWKLKETRDISLPTFAIFCMGIFLWLLYGILISNWPIIAANLLTLALGITILVFKLKYG